MSFPLFKRRPSQRPDSSNAPSVDRFRALIIGRANAGKTTILKSICGSKDSPLVMSRVVPSAERGRHNINDELVFASNPRFIFHDSEGFESGGKVEVENMMKFIEERANASTLQEKLHAIWYCIPTDNNRLNLTAEEKFFNECDPAGVPVILLFTKFDAREAKSFTALKDEGQTPENARQLAAEHAKKMFESERTRFTSPKYPPSAVIYLRDMHEEAEDDGNNQCTQIIDATTQNLKDETLKHLLVSVQKVNIKLCLKYALESDEETLSIRDVLRREVRLGSARSDVISSEMWIGINSWFPHFFSKRVCAVINFSALCNFLSHAKVQMYEAPGDLGYGYGYGTGYGTGGRYYRGRRGRRYYDHLNYGKISLYVAEGMATPPSLSVLYHCACLLIIAEHSSWLDRNFDNISDALILACLCFKKSGTRDRVNREISQSFGDNVVDILNDDERYRQVIAPRLYEIVTNHVLSHDYTLPMVGKLQWFFLKYYKRAGMRIRI